MLLKSSLQIARLLLIYCVQMRQIFRRDRFSTSTWKICRSLARISRCEKFSRCDKFSTTPACHFFSRCSPVLVICWSSEASAFDHDFGMIFASYGFILSVCTQNGRCRLLRCNITLTGPTICVTRNDPLNLRRHLATGVLFRVIIINPIPLFVALWTSP